MSESAYFTTPEVLRMLHISRNELYTILRPVRSKGAILPALFTPEEQTMNKLTQSHIFTQRDIMKMRRYFKALKEYKAAREELRQTGSKPSKEWMEET